MVKKIAKPGQEPKPGELPAFDESKSKYNFDGRIIPHIHLKNGNVVRLDTKEEFAGKNKIRTLTQTQLETEMAKLT